MVVLTQISGTVSWITCGLKKIRVAAESFSGMFLFNKKYVKYVNRDIQTQMSHVLSCIYVQIVFKIIIKEESF